jgi:nucleoside-diphosphate-sugar epimerase
MKTVLVTGATGFLGHHLVHELLKQVDTKVIAILGRPEDKANALPESPNLTIYPCTALFNTDFGHVDTLIHTAFSRGDNLPGLTRSIELTEQIIELVNNQDIDSMINISSQGIYKGQKPGEKVDETGFVEPNTAYGLAKWAVENMIKIGCAKKYTNVRMASLSANARFLDFFVDSVIAGKDITVTAPNQYASIMDVSDAVEGILSVTNLPFQERSDIYNLGPGIQHSILEFAEEANFLGETYGFETINVIVEDNGNNFATCMDCNKMISQTGWSPKVTKTEMLKKMYNHKIK